MSQSPKTSPVEAVAAPPTAPYTAVLREEPAASVPWWKEAVRSWVPVLALAAVLVFQMVGLQRQIGELRTDLQREMGVLRDDLRSEMGDLRDDLRSEISDLRVELGERITRLETLMEVRAEPASGHPGG